MSLTAFSIRRLRESPWGNPLFPIVSGIVSDELFKGNKLKFNIKYVAKYVDDSFWIVKSNLVNGILPYFNQFHPRLKFTREYENNRSNNFLNLALYKER